MTRRTAMGMAVALCLSLSAPFCAPARAEVPAGTEVMLQFDQELSTKTAKKGDRIPLTVVSDVVVDGKTLIKAGSAAAGTVTSVKKPGRFGKRGELKIQLDSVKDRMGDMVSLEQYQTGKRFEAGGPGAAAGGLLILGPIGLVGGAFVKGDNVTVEKGTRIQAKVKGPSSSETDKK